MDEINIQADKAERESDFGLVAKLKYGDLKEQEQLLKLAEEKLNTLPEETRFTSDTVTENDIAIIVSKWTGIPLQKMMQSEKEKLLHLEEELGKRVIGQKAVSYTHLRAHETVLDLVCRLLLEKKNNNDCNIICTPQHQ